VRSRHHVLYKHLIKPSAAAEVTMADYLLRFVVEACCCCGTATFSGTKNLKQVRQQQKAQLLARIKSNLVFEPTEMLADGSYLSKMYPSYATARKDRNGIVAHHRVQLTDDNRPTKALVHRLLDDSAGRRRPTRHRTGDALSRTLGTRTDIDEFEDPSTGAAVLRSKTRPGVVQEIEGLLLAHFAVRRLLFEAAVARGSESTATVVTATLKILRCRLPEVPRARSGRRRWWATCWPRWGRPSWSHAVIGSTAGHQTQDEQLAQEKASPPQPSPACKPFRETIQIE